MSNIDGKHVCDRCGEDVDNGGLNFCAVATDLTDDGHVINYHLCRKNGCATKVLTVRNLAARKESELLTGVATPGE